MSYRDIFRLRPCWARSEEVQAGREDYDIHDPPPEAALPSPPRTPQPIPSSTPTATPQKQTTWPSVRKVLASTLSTSTGQSVVQAELTEHAGDTDAAIDTCVGESGGTFYHPAGSCAMGSVVDGACRVVRLNRLRVVDATVIPLPLGAHYQATWAEKF
jgi:choline dehydrogenase-like flavoprotein